MTASAESLWIEGLVVFTPVAVETITQKVFILQASGWMRGSPVLVDERALVEVPTLMVSGRSPEEIAEFVTDLSHKDRPKSITIFANVMWVKGLRLMVMAYAFPGEDESGSEPVPSIGEVALARYDPHAEHPDLLSVVSPPVPRGRPTS